MVWFAPWIAENWHRKYFLEPPKRVNHTIAPLKAWKYIFSNDIIKIIVDCTNTKPFFKHQNVFQKLLPKKMRDDCQT